MFFCEATDFLIEIVTIDIAVDSASVGSSAVRGEHTAYTPRSCVSFWQNLID